MMLKISRMLRSSSTINIFSTTQTPWFRGFMPQARRRIGRHGETDHEPGSLVRLAVHTDPPAVKIHDPVDRGETEPRALLLGGEEREEDLLEVFLLDPFPGVLKADLHHIGA